MVTAQTFEKLLPYTAYGDAAGLPFEAKPPLRPGSVEGLNDTVTNPYLGYYREGTWSDDTHLAIASSKSLIESDGFDLDSQAYWHIEAYRHVLGDTSEPDLVPPIVTKGRNNGWGKSTTNSIERLMAGTSPLESGEVGGGGNGVLMKMAPLVLWQIARNTETSQAEQEIIEFTKMTHCSPEAIVSSLVHRNYIIKLIARRSLFPEQLLEDSAVAAKDYEAMIGAPDPILSRLLSELAQRAKHGHLDRQDIFDLTPKHGFYAPETLAMVYGNLVISSAFPRVVFSAIELGGDSDSIGSITAGLHICRDPLAEKPKDYDKVFDMERLERISKQLANRALNNS